MSKQERMQVIREKTKDKYEQMRVKASKTVKGVVGAAKGSMGPIKGFGELQDSIMKMREHFDFVVLGKIAPAFPVQKDGSLQTSSSCSALEAGNDSCC
jgi:hypothetical protein